MLIVIWYCLTKTDKNQNQRDLKTTRAEQGWDYVGPGSSLEAEKEMKGSERNGTRGFVDGVMVHGTIQRGSILHGGEKPKSIPVWGGGKGEGETEAVGLWEKLNLNTQR